MARRVIFPAVAAADDAAVPDPALRPLGGAMAAAVLRRCGRAAFGEKEQAVRSE